jgi:hypothetical protein
MSDLERAYKALSAKKPIYNRLFDYYDGNQPLLYTNKRLEEIFKGLDAIFIENWCAVVIDAVLDRINLKSLQASDQTSQDMLTMLWDGSQLALESDDVHQAALITGEAFILAELDDAGGAQAYYNDPRLVHAFYDLANPRVMSFCAKWWVDEALGRVRLNLYYPERTEHYISTSKSVSNANTFHLDETGIEDNPYSRIPVFHFRTQRRVMLGDLQNVVPIQNGINKLLTDMMVAAEYGAFKQRWVISEADIKGKLKNAPNEVWSIPAGDGAGQHTQVGEFSPTELSNYLDAIDNLAQTLSSITRTPKHYFFREGETPSGEALLTMESPLVKKVNARIERFTPVWREAAVFLLELAGVAAAPADIIPKFEDPESVQPRTSAEITQIRVSSGVPLTTALRDEGWEEEELTQMEADKAAEQAAAQQTLAQALLRAQRGFDQGGAGA